jgi:hypothetical protein
MDCGQQDTREKAMLTGTGKDMLALLDEAKLNGPKMPSTPPYYSDAGWLQWPDNEAYSFQFMRMLGAAQEDATTVSECFFAARLISPGDDVSWYEAWKSVAETNSARGNEAFARGGLNAATGTWLRASNYYRCAELFMDATDPRREVLFRSMRRCARLYLEHSRPRGRGRPNSIPGRQLPGRIFHRRSLRSPLATGRGLYRWARPRQGRTALHDAKECSRKWFIASADRSAGLRSGHG